MVYKIDPIIESVMKNLRERGDDVINLYRIDVKKREKKLKQQMVQIQEELDAEASECSGNNSENSKISEADEKSEESSVVEESVDNSIKNTPNIQH